MITDTIFDALEQRGADRYTLATWRSRVMSRHHQTILEAVVIAIVFLLVLLFAATASSAQTAAEPAMTHSCAAMHEAAAKEVQALKKTVTDARASNDIVVMRKALDATLEHITGMEARTAKCEGMMMKGRAAKEPAKTPDAAKHDH